MTRGRGGTGEAGSGSEAEGGEGLLSAEDRQTPHAAESVFDARHP